MEDNDIGELGLPFQVVDGSRSAGPKLGRNDNSSAKSVGRSTSGSVSSYECNRPDDSFLCFMVFAENEEIDWNRMCYNKRDIHCVCRD